MARLPKVGGDQGNWGDILNDYLSQSHNDDGSLKNDTVGAPQLKSQSVTSAAIADGAIAEAKLSSAVQTKLNAETTIADGSITTSKLADDSVTNAKLAGAGAADGVATLDANAKLPETQVPERLSEAALNDTIGAAIPVVERLVVNRAWTTTSGAGATVNRIGTSKSAFRTGREPAADLRLAFGGWTQVYGTGDVALTNASPLPIRAAIEYPSGTVTPVYFNGARDGQVHNGALLVSDAIGIDIPADTLFWVRVFANPASGDSVPNVRNTTGGTNGEGWVAIDDRTDAGAAAISQNNANAYAPFAVYGKSRRIPTGVISGDSIGRGTSDTQPLGLYSDTGGFIARALNAAKLPWIALSVPSETAATFLTTAGHLRRMPLLRGCTFAVVMYGTNDIQTALSPTFAGVATALLGVWRLYATRGIQPWACTLGPTTTSTDSWATVGNQTINTASRDNVLRVLLNTWIRDGAPFNSAGAPVAAGTVDAVRVGDESHPLAGYFETADVMESARNSGLWRAGYTSDGLHPNATGYAAMAAVIDTSVFA